MKRTSNMTIIDGSRDISMLRSEGLFQTSYPHTFILTGKDMKVHYNAPGFSTSGSGPTMRAKIRQLLAAP